MINHFLCRPPTSRLWLPSECFPRTITKVFTAHQPSYCGACELWHVRTELKVSCCPVTVVSVSAVKEQGFGNECQTQKGNWSIKKIVVKVSFGTGFQKGFTCKVGFQQGIQTSQFPLLQRNHYKFPISLLGYTADLVNDGFLT